MDPQIHTPASNIAYIISETYLKQCDRNVKVLRRASITHALISAYKLLEKIWCIAPVVATDDDLKNFHSEDYVEYLKNINDDEFALEYGLAYDCPIIDNLFSYVCAIAGGTITAARCLALFDYKIAINWGGGWHHAKKDEADGFCYVNDIVLGILILKKKYERVLYVDLDAHHGNGVEDAFAHTDKVMTVSFHKYEGGFFPGSGSVLDVGYGLGESFTVNVPLKDGIRDAQYYSIFSRVMDLTKSKFKADAIVCQCGADGLTGDPMEAFNLTPVGYGNCIRYLLSWNVPILFLGGGGYNIPNTARCWTYLTSIIVQEKVPSDIPDNPFFLEFGPDYAIEIPPGNRRSNNTDQDLDFLVHLIAKNLNVQLENKNEFCEFS